MKKTQVSEYINAGNCALEKFLIFIIKHKRLTVEQRSNLFTKVKKNCSIKYIRDGSIRRRLLKGIEKIGDPDPKRYFAYYVKKILRT